MKVFAPSIVSYVLLSHKFNFNDREMDNIKKIISIYISYFVSIISYIISYKIIIWNIYKRSVNMLSARKGIQSIFFSEHVTWIVITVAALNLCWSLIYSPLISTANIISARLAMTIKKWFVNMRIMGKKYPLQLITNKLLLKTICCETTFRIGCK